MRTEEEIRRAHALLLNDILDQIDAGHTRPRKTFASEKLRTLRWVLGEVRELNPE